jgi:Mrp family chromosome partitioning ATPase
MAATYRDEVQKLLLTTIGNGEKVVAVTAAQPQSGVTTLCRALAAASAASGIRTLLLDLARPVASGHIVPPWLPGFMNVRHAISLDPLGFDLLTAVTTVKTRELFNTPAALRAILRGELTEYDAIVVDIAPLRPVVPRAVDALCAAASCDSVFLLFVANRDTRQQVIEAREALTQAGVQLAGVIVNDMENPSLGAELARQALRWKRFAPRWTAAAAARLMRIDFLK